MEHEEPCDCPFQDGCESYSDPLIDAARKSASGLGCRGASDVHRARHCKGFRCKYLSAMLSDALASPDPRRAG